MWEQRIVPLNAKQDLPNQFLTEAPVGWRRYGEAFRRCSLETQSKWIDSAGEITSSSTDQIHWLDHSAISIATHDDATEWINCRREDYAFWVGRSDKTEPWMLKLLVKSSDLQASHHISRDLLRSFYPDFLYRQDSLLEAIQKPYFKLLSVEHDPVDQFPNLYRVVFDYEHPFRKTAGDYQYNWVQNGTLWLDADNCWVIVRFQLESLLNSKSEREWSELEFEFDSQTYCGVRLPVKCQHFDLDKDWKRKKEVDESYASEFRRISPDELDLQLLNLTHYGFAEPDFGIAGSTIRIEIDDMPEINVNDQVTIPFTVRNVGRYDAEIIKVAAC